MALRLLEAVLPRANGPRALELIRGAEPITVSEERLSEERILVRALMNSDQTEAVIDALEDRFQDDPQFRVLLFAVEATLPRPPLPARADQKSWSQVRISRAELHTSLEEAAMLSPLYIITVALSAVVAAIGLIRNSVAILIGAMVIAPLLGPNMALALGATLGDLHLIARAGLTITAGIGVALAVSVLAGATLDVDPTGYELASRTTADLMDVVLALAAGAAGAIAVTTGAPAALIGVMVAVALVPPLCAVGLLLGSGDVAGALGAGLLLGTNILSIIIAGVLTFALQGLRPRTWWEVDRARRATWAALATSCILLGILIATIVIFH